ncbi:MAG: insulinase family protein [Pseudomonadota bacterium]
MSSTTAKNKPTTSSKLANSAPNTLSPAFNWIKTTKIDSLNIELEIYQHINTGAMHYHLSADNNENVFLVALRTIPQDSSGVAHILEHTALCGSEHYPVRDPFFMMIRRSLNTFMNAFTSTDWTAYPFASQNNKDFNNLLEVYLDAVFFSRLHELDFAQEGHRLEFEEKEDSNSDLLFKGVVFNEMKGAMSSVVSTVWHTLSKYVFPSSTYHFNSGGEPTDIPDLSYRQLKDFYKTYYHPSNAIFMTYGDIAAHVHQQKFEDLVLSRFQALDVEIHVDNEKRLYAPIAVEESYALDENSQSSGNKEEIKNKTHLVIAWLLGQSIDLEQQIKAQLLSNLLLDNSASPLLHALETTDIGSSPSSLCGLEDSNKEMMFVCGLEGANAQDAENFEKLVLDVLHQVAKDGVDKELLDAVLHQLEFHQREISGDHYPYGLQLILSGISTAIHRGDVATVMDVDRVLEKIREEIKADDFVQNLVKDLLLSNQHRVRLTMKPDTQLSSRKESAEKQRLQAIKDSLSEQQKQQIIKQSQQLIERQEQEDDESILPKVGLEDIPESIKEPKLEQLTQANMVLNQYAQGTNGLSYQQLLIEMPDMDEQLQQVMPLFCRCLTELGCDDKSYMETQLLHSSISGGISAFTSYRGEIADEQKVKGLFVLSTKSLNRNFHFVADLLKKTLETIRFDEVDKIKEIISQSRSKSEQSITGNGHHLAMLAASSGMSPIALLTHKQQGLNAVLKLKELDDEITKENNGEKEPAEQTISVFIDKLKQIHQLLVNAPKQFLLVTEAQQLKQQREYIFSLWENSNITAPTHVLLDLQQTRKSVKQAWYTSTQVNFCAKVYPTVSIAHQHAPALTILGSFLRNGYLHRTIREQGGAYGGGAMQDSANACFKFFSYRDPRLTETLDDFDQALIWLKETQHQYQPLEEAILSVISSLDKPGSPAGEAKQAFQNHYYGRSLEQRQAFRAKILQVTIEDLQQLADIYFKPENASIAVVCNHKESEQCQSLELEEFYL